MTVSLIIFNICMTFLLEMLGKEDRLQLWIVLQGDCLDYIWKGWEEDRKVRIYASCLKIVEIFSYFAILIRLFRKKEERGYKFTGKRLVNLYPNHLSYATWSVHSMVGMVSNFASCWTVPSKSILSKGRDPGLCRKRKWHEMCYVSPFL